MTQTFKLTHQKVRGILKRHELPLFRRYHTDGYVVTNGYNSVRVVYHTATYCEKHHSRPFCHGCDKPAIERAAEILRVAGLSVVQRRDDLGWWYLSVRL